MRINWKGDLKSFSHLIGKTYGELTILEIMDSIDKTGIHKKCRYRCSCGKEGVYDLKRVIYKDRKSCGHLNGRKDYSYLIGKTYGELTILEVSEPVRTTTGNPFRLCTCICSCGEKTTKRLFAVLNGKTKTCGTCDLSLPRKKDYSNLIGKQFGELTILEISEPIKTKRSNRMCICQCSCGKVVAKVLNSVLSERVRSCGHLYSAREERREIPIKDIIGKTYGKLTIISVTKPLKDHYSFRKCTCQCSCGREVNYFLYFVESGLVTSCAYCSRFSKRKESSYLFGETVGNLTIVGYADDPDDESANNEERKLLLKCSCGHEFVNTLNGITSGNFNECTKCQKLFYESEPKVRSFYEGLSLKNIHWDEKEGKFVVAIKRGGKWFKARALSLAEAVIKREQRLKDAEKYVKANK